MKAVSFFSNIFVAGSLITATSLFYNSTSHHIEYDELGAGGAGYYSALSAMPGDTAKKDTLKYPFQDNPSDPYSNPNYPNSPLFLGNPSNVTNTVEYNPDENQYDINSMIGDEFFRNPNYMTFQEFMEQQNKETTKKYWQQLASGDNLLNQKRGFNPKLYVGGRGFEQIFGSNVIDIRPQGSAELTFGLNTSKNENPSIPVSQRKVTTFDFKQKIQMNVIGNIGTKLKVGINYNTEASFDFDNTVKLEYTGQEDEIIKKIEAGNVTLPLTGTLIQGSQSLFGIKTQLQFGKLLVTGLFSQQKGKSSTIEVKGGAQTNEFEIQGDNYEANKHFFLSQYFRNNYDNALKSLPVISSNINITKIEVWLIKPGSYNDTRSLFGFVDLGELNPGSTSPLVSTNMGSGTCPTPTQAPSNESNCLYKNLTDSNLQYRNLRDISYQGITQVLNDMSVQGFTAPRDFERLENAVKLNSSEYFYNAQLGYISLKSTLQPNQALAVAYEYQIGGQVYRVGDLTTAGITPPNRLFVKILKSSNVDPNQAVWDLMMKNIYSMGAYGVQEKDFRMDVLYYDDSTGSNINYIPAGASEPNVNAKPLIKLLNLDRLNAQRDPIPDGIFDFSDGITINASEGRIIFPVVEPFGSSLKSKFNQSQTNYEKYIYQELYDSSRTAAQQLPEKNKFKLTGKYSSSISSEIPLNAINIPQGSVKVTSGGVPLTENVDYTVDYNLGRVKIINESYLNSANSIQITLESNSLFSIQSKRLMGIHADYAFSKDFQLGATIMNLTERPLTQKINVGDEPISNTIWGIDGGYKTESRFITKLVDYIPLIETKEISNVTINGEFAQFIPGHPNAIGKSGTAYIDDFEGSQSSIDLRNPGNWYLASTPQGQPGLFPEGIQIDNKIFGMNRAQLAWYNIDPSVFYRGSNLTPSNITDNELSNHLVREIREDELFPDKDYGSGVQPPTMPVLNLSFTPQDRGPYNFDLAPLAGITAGLNVDGKLNAPETRWGGMMRRLETSDFEAANVEFITIWMMDPFNDDNPTPNNRGKLYFNLGQVSEDMCHDGFRNFENGLPCPTNSNPVDSTVWGLYPANQTNPTNAFDNDPDCRSRQDVGIDGLIDADERNFPEIKTNYLDAIAATFGTSSGAYTLANTDPSNDDFQFFRGDNLDNDPNGGSILYRYNRYNGMEGNSPVSTGTYATSSSNLPDAEDINRDGNMDIYENYYQYHVDIDPTKMVVGQNYIVDKTVGTAKMANNQTRSVTWYQLRIPVTVPESVVGTINDFKSIGYIRMMMKGFDENMVLRFARFELTRSEWRKYQYTLFNPNETIDPPIPGDTQFDLGAVNIEENSGRTPINYVIPPGIEQETNTTSSQLQRLNEQSLSMKICNLQDGDARACYKNLGLDIRRYKHLQMVVHCEAGPDGKPLKDNDLALFIRIGSDFNKNFYEYEVPLVVSPYGNNNPDIVWPSTNDIDIELDKFIQLKLNRNNSGTSPTQVYYESYNRGTLFVLGTPNLENVKTIMIGIRNPKKGGIVYYSIDDGQSKCSEIWVNELRLSDFDEKGGYAANARIVTKLANLGNLSLSGGIRTIGFGGIEQKVQERSLEKITIFDIATNLELGKFFGESSGLSIPFYYSYGQTVSNPQYNPLDPDVPFETALNSLETKEARDDLKRKSQDYYKRKSFNFTNVRLNNTKGGKSHLWDISNFNLTYAHTYLFHRDINTEYDIIKNDRGLLGYNFNTSSKPIEPFKKVIGSSKWLRLIKDFNFNPLPSTLNADLGFDKTYGETLLRNNTSYNSAIDTTFNKIFNLMRGWGLKWDLAKSLKLSFDGRNLSKVDEPIGRVDTKEKKEFTRKNLVSFGRNTDYSHQGDITYQVPLNKIPLLDWTSLNAKYGFNYSWMTAPLQLDSISNTAVINPALGNTIQNSKSIQLNGNLTLTSLYNKVPFFKKLMSSGSNQPAPKMQKPKIDIPKNPSDTAKTKKEKEKKPGEIPTVVKILGKLVLAVKNVGGTYTETNGTGLPGFLPVTEVMGNNYYRDKNGNLVTAPGWGFVFGSQEDLRYKAAQNNWLTSDTIFNGSYNRSYSQNITGRSTIEPFTNLRIELNLSKQYTRSLTENYRLNADGSYKPYGTIENGNYSVSFISWRTAFSKDNKDYSSPVFQKFAENRIIISDRLGSESPYSSGLDSAGYRDGYSGTQQEVLTAAFLAAYSGKNASNTKLNPYQVFPMPNWRITYDISKVSALKKLFTSVTLSHGYRSTFSINSFNTNLLYSDPGGTGYTDVRDLGGNFIPNREAQQVSITESYSPLIGIDMNWKKNGLFTRFELKRDRNLSLTYTGIQLTEIKTNEIVIGAGYRIPKFSLPFKIGGKKVKLNNELNLTADFSIRKNNTIIRRMIENSNIPTAGINVFSIKLAADYVLNERMNLRFFYDRIVNTPVVSTSYPNSNTNFGISIRFTLAQ